METSVLLVGGDRRQTWLARSLAPPLQADTYAVPDLPDTARPGPYDVLILPCPCLDGEGRLRAPGSGLPLSVLDPFLGPQTRVFGGSVNRAAEALSGRCASVTDLLLDPLAAEENAALTAEAAIVLTEQTLEAAVSGCRAAVLGFGRIGRRLSALLLAHGAAVTAAARREEVRAAARALGCAACSFGELEGSRDLVFNTVPARTLSPSQLASLGKGCIWVELASAPGGLPDPLPEGLRVLPAGSLPGRILPRSAAQTLRRAIFRSLR